MRGDLEAFERVDPEDIGDPLSQRGSDAGHGLEDTHRVECAPQPFQLAPMAGPQHLDDRGGDATSDVGDREYPLRPLALEDFP